MGGERPLAGELLLERIPDGIERYRRIAVRRCRRVASFQAAATELGIIFVMRAARNGVVDARLDLTALEPFDSDCRFA